jgi:hypothetical protein
VRLTPLGRQSFEAMAKQHEQWIVELFAGLEPAIVQRLYKHLGELRRVRRQASGVGENGRGVMGTAHVDTFARDNLPPREQQPEYLFDLPELAFPAQLNCATELLDRRVAEGGGDAPCIRDTRRDVLDVRRPSCEGQSHRQRAVSARWAWCRATACSCAHPTTR